MISGTAQESAAAPHGIPSANGRRWVGFVLVGGLIYLLVYLLSEHFVYEYGQRNRLFVVATAPLKSYDFVILGASHAMPFGFEDMNRRLEDATKSSVLNLSIEGGGIVPARFILDYFLAGHGAKTVVYILDSFALYSSQWNEIRLDDAKLLKRAPFGLALPPLLWKYPSTRELIPGYVSGFYKINNADRFGPDISDMERNEFHRVYRANPYLDRQRLAYLYPAQIDRAAFDRYAAMFADFAADLDRRGIRLLVIRPPLPGRVLRTLTGEDAFDARIQDILAAHRFEFRDFGAVANDDAFFFDTDHLNRDGVINFIDKYLAGALRDGQPQ